MGGAEEGGERRVPERGERRGGHWKRREKENEGEKEEMRRGERRE